MLTSPALGPRGILAGVRLVLLLCALAILPARADQVTDSVSDRIPSQIYGQASGQVLNHASHQASDQITSQAAAQGPIEVSDEVVLPWRLVIEGAPALRSGIEASLASVLRRYEGSATGIQVERMMQQIKPLALDALAAEGYFRATVDLAVEAPTRDALARAVAGGQPEDGVLDSTNAGTGTEFRPVFGVGAGPGAPIMPKLSRLLSSGPGRVIRLQVVTGERTSVGQIHIRFEGTIADEQAEAAARAAARAAFTLAEGSPFRSTDWESAKQAVLRQVRARRFAAARIASSRADVDPETTRADLDVVVDSGPAYRFGELRVRGLEPSEQRLLVRLNNIHAGEDYSQAALADLQSRLQGSQYYSFVAVTVETTGADPQALPVDVELGLAQRHKVELGAGYSTNNGPRATAQYTDIDLFGLGIQWRNLFSLEAREQTASSELRLPTDEDGWQLRGRAALGHQDDNGLTIHDQTLLLERAKSIGRIERAVTLEYVRSDESPDGGTASIKRALAPGYGWRYRSFDDLLDPRGGYEVGARVSAASQTFGSDTSFARASARLIAVWPLGAHNSLIARVDGGVVTGGSSEHIPDAFLFRIGGDQSLRGYRYLSIGPREGNAVVGGRLEAITGAEIIHWLTDKVGVAGFYERGDAVDHIADFQWKAGYGAGLRWRTGVGPINADIAYGEAVHEVRIHLSIGFLF